MNLVSNACDAMRHPSCRERTLAVTTVLAHDGQAQVVVTDSGPGIAAGEVDHIFEPFFTTKESGLGLGLPISRRIARTHGGSLTAEQRDGGASFRLTLPSAKAAARRDAPQWSRVA